MDKLKMHSPDLIAANIEKIAAHFPNCVTEAKDKNGAIKRAIDFDQLRQELAASVVEGPQERYRLDWPGKREALLAANAPVAKTLQPCRADSIDFDTTQNLFIEGDNLDALKLLQETYLGKVKLIYIDPPYNTGKEFIYDDDFQEEAESYFRRSLQKDSTGAKLVSNTESNGRFHSDWLSSLYPRLKLARNLLRDDGIIFISIDDNEVTNVRKLCDEIFGASRFLAQIIVQSNKRGQTYKEISKTHEYLIVYGRSDSIEINEMEKDGDALPFSDTNGKFDLWELRNRNPKFGRFNRPNLYFPIYVLPGSVDECGYLRVSLEAKSKEAVAVFPLNSAGQEGCWRWGKEKILGSDLSSSSPVLVAKQRRDGNWNIYEKSRKSTTKVKSIWTDNDVISEQGTIEMRELGLGDLFDHPKPCGLLRRCIQMATSGADDLILDFYAGSCSTAHAALSLNAEDGGNRRFIMIQLDEHCGESTKAFEQGFKTIADIGRERIRRAGKKFKAEYPLMSTSLDVGFRALRLNISNVKDVFYL
jgi:adenine-specific DNA-methyltransferase